MSGKKERFNDTLLPNYEENNSVVVEENSVTDKENVVIEETKETPTPKTSGQVHFVIPENVKLLLNKKAYEEERTVTVVINRALRNFLEKETCEDRPYISIELDKVVKISFTSNNEIIEKLNARAKNEGRTTTTLLTKAILDYVSDGDSE